MLRWLKALDMPPQSTSCKNEEGGGILMGFLITTRNIFYFILSQSRFIHFTESLRHSEAVEGAQMEVWWSFHLIITLPTAAFLCQY